MGNIWKAFKSGTKAAIESFNPGQYSVEGKNVICPHCENREFSEGSAQLNTAGMTFVGLDWANKSAYTLLCSKCGRIEWFMRKPTRQ